MVFLLADDSYLHFAFETGYNRTGLIKNAGYDLRLFDRDGRKVHTVVIYTADVIQRPAALSTGSLVYNPDAILMGEYDGDVIFSKLEAKIKAGQELADTDMLNLVLLPLMKHSIPRKELAADSIRLAQSIADPAKRNACIAAAFAFASRYLDKTEVDKLLEVLKMTDIGTMLVSERSAEIAKSMLRDKVTVEFVSRHTGLDMDTVQQLKNELESE